MIRIDSFEGGAGALLMAVEEAGDLVGKALLIVFEGPQIVGAAIQNGLGDFGLGADGVDGDQRSGQMQARQQQRYHIDIV